MAGTFRYQNPTRNFPWRCHSRTARVPTDRTSPLQIYLSIDLLPEETSPILPARPSRNRRGKRSAVSQKVHLATALHAEGAGLRRCETLRDLSDCGLFRPEVSVVLIARAEGPGRPRSRRAPRPNGLPIRALTERQTPTNGRAFSPPITEAADVQGLQALAGGTDGLSGRKS